VSADIPRTVKSQQVHCRLTPKLQLIATVQTECSLTLHILYHKTVKISMMTGLDQKPTKHLCLNL